MLRFVFEAVAFVVDDRVPEKQDPAAAGGKGDPDQNCEVGRDVRVAHAGEKDHD